MNRMDILEPLLNLFKAYGYWIVFFGVMLENAGLPVPGETILLAAGFFASQHHFSVLAVMSIATTGAVMGDNCGYWVGHRVGRRLLIRYGRYVMLTESRFRGMEKYFESHGDKTVLVARFITGFRVFTALFAGATGMRWSKFLLFNVLGAISWAVVMTLLGFFFGKSWNLLEQYIKGAGLGLAAVLAVAFVVYQILRRRKKNPEGENNATDRQVD
ncbi:MAG TPA: DedA family protein [Blastocatellia bacterium]|nr:DedA family protein [Blastocatellia bacterium]